MGAREDQVLRTAKEVVVKFIEIGRISPANFPESFQMIYEAINTQVKEGKTGAPVDKDKA